MFGFVLLPQVVDLLLLSILRLHEFKFEFPYGVGWYRVPCEKKAMNIIEWYARKTIKQMDCGEIITCIKKIWLAANYFYNIEVETGDKGSYHVSFYHDLQEKRYSDYWSKYFTVLLEQSFPCHVEIFSRNASFRLIISPIQA